MRRSVTPAIPPSMYRHFALVTVSLTAVLAMFAQGEGGEAAQALIVQKPAPAVAAATKPRLADKRSAWESSGYDSGESGFDAGFGMPMDSPHGGSESAIFPGEELAQEAGYSPDYLASLSFEEREFLLKGLQENGLLSPDARTNRSDALAAASSRRSGAAATAD